MDTPNAWEWLPNPWPGKAVLHLGCGARPMTGATNHDRWKHSAWVDLDFDLDQLPWPSGSPLDVIAAYDVVEHVADVLGFCNECHALLRPGGLLEFRVAASDNPASFIDPTHKHFLTSESFNMLDPSTNQRACYGRLYQDSIGRPLAPWEIESVERANPDPRWPDRGDWLFRLRRLDP